MGVIAYRGDVFDQELGRTQSERRRDDDGRPGISEANDRRNRLECRIVHNVVLEESLAMSSRILMALLLLSFGNPFGVADDPVFSGPQPGETLVPFKVVAVYGEDAGQEIDPIELAGGKPTLLVFVHKLTRPGMALARGLSSYAKSQSGAVSGVVWLDDDKAKAESYLNRAKKSLNFTAPVGISVDGGEGPGAYGLNRNVELTILIADKNQVKANFALVQPSVTEGPRIAGALAKLLDREAPTAAEFEKLAYPGGGMAKRRNMANRPAAETRSDADLRSLMRAVIAAEVSESDLRDAIKAVDDWVGDVPARRKLLGRMAGAVLERGLGSQQAQQQIKGWHQEYGDPKNSESSNPPRD